jgi:hypothetical protein
MKNVAVIIWGIEWEDEAEGFPAGNGLGTKVTPPLETTSWNPGLG